MNSKQIETLKKIIENEENKYNFFDYIKNYLDADRLEQIETIKELKDYLQELNEDNEITDMQIIYCDEAIKFLAENDPSLRDSLDLATELGYNIDKISSDLLASLLASKRNEEDYHIFVNYVINDMENVFNE